MIRRHAVLAEHLGRARPLGVHERQERLGEARADEPLGHRLAREEDAVAVGDGEGAALGEVALAHPRAEPGEVDPGDEDLRLPVVADRQRDRQVGGVIGPGPGEVADGEPVVAKPPPRTRTLPATPSAASAPAAQRTFPAGSATAKPLSCGSLASSSARYSAQLAAMVRTGGAKASVSSTASAPPTMRSISSATIWLVRSAWSRTSRSRS